MKKIALIVVLLICLTGTISCVADDSEYLGKWYLKFVSSEGIKIPAELLNMSYYFEFTNDKVIMGDDETSREGTWSQKSETLIHTTFPDREFELVLEDDYLTLEAEGTSMYFSKTTCNCDCESLQAQIKELTAELEALKGISEQTKNADMQPIEDYPHIIINTFKLDYIGFDFDKSYDGKDVIKINYTFTNNSDKTTSFDIPLYLTAFQDGIQMENYYISGTDNGTQIRPGKSIDVVDAFYLRDFTNPIELEFNESFSWTDEYKTSRLLEISK